MFLNLLLSENYPNFAFLQRKERQTIVASANKNKGTKIFCKVNDFYKILVQSRRKIAFVL
jgi:hypothetical protein